MKKILLIEDDIFLGQTLLDFFASNDLSVSWAKDGNSGLKLYKTLHPDLILLDVALPDIDGFEVITEIQQTDTSTPVIFMTGTEFSCEQQIKGFQLGAINYLKKPVVPQVVLAQINQLLFPPQIKRYTFNNLNISIDNQVVTIDKNEIVLKEKEAKLLTLLLENKNRVLSRKDILTAIWKDNQHYLNNALDSNLSSLRKALQPFPRIKIVSIYGGGIKLGALSYPKHAF